MDEIKQLKLQHDMEMKRMQDELDRARMVAMPTKEAIQEEVDFYFRLYETLHTIKTILILTVHQVTR